MAEWTTESLRAALDSGDLGFWEEDNHGASSPDRRYGAWIETDDLPSPEEFDAWLTAHDAEVIREYLEKRQIPVVRIETSDELRPILDAAMKEARAKALEEAAEGFASRLPDGTGNGRAYNSWRVAEILRARAAAIRAGQDQPVRRT